MRKGAGGQWENEAEGKCLLPSINTLGIYGTHALHSIVSWSEMQSVVAVVGGSGRNSRMAGHSSSHFTDRSGSIQPFEFRSQSFRSLYSQISPPRDISVVDNLSRSGKVEDGLIDSRSGKMRREYRPVFC